MTRNERRELWEKRLADHAASGQGITAWCEKNFVTSRQFYYWRRKLGARPLEKEQPVKWLSLKYDAPQLSIAEDTIPVYIGKATIELRKGFDRELFGEIVQVLQTV